MGTFEHDMRAVLAALDQVGTHTASADALARTHTAAQLLSVLEHVGRLQRSGEQVRDVVVAALRARPVRAVGGDRPSWNTIAVTAGEKRTTVYDRNERFLRGGVAALDQSASPVTDALAALGGIAIAPGQPASTDDLVAASQASFERRVHNSENGAAVLGALADRVATDEGLDVDPWARVAELTGIPEDIARAWGSAPSASPGGE